jgi:hypothetical protein
MSTYAQSTSGQIYRFPSQEECIRASTDAELDMIIYGQGILECSTPEELEIARDEVRRREK